MKLSKKLETEILKVYHTYWESYINGDIKIFSGTLDNTFELIGTSESEVCHTKEDGIKFLKAQVKEFGGKVEMRNRKINVVPVKEVMLVNEQCEIYIFTGNHWSFYSKIRISTLLRKTFKGWKVFQQHGSFPDLHVQEGETLAFAKISKENLELRDAIERATVELKTKNRVLEIDTSLEKVRAVAMGMRKPDDLSSIGKIIFNELKLLGFANIRNAEIVINNEDKESVKSCHYSEYGHEEVIEINYKENPIVKKWATDLKKADNIFVPVTIREKQMKEWVAYRKKLGYKTDPKMAKAKSVYYYSYSTGLGALSISTWQKLTNEQIQILERFRNVFQLAYKRYVDITTADAQAREAQIQLALERVRSRSMAMKSSDELAEVSFLLNKQVVELGIPTRGCAFNIYGEHDSTEWFSNLEGTLPIYKTPRENIFLKYYEAGQQSETLYIEEFSGKKIKEHYKYLSSLTVLAEGDENADNINRVIPDRQIDHVAYFKYGYLLFITLQPAPQSHDIFKRFAKEFEQTYTRFLDLQKAEAQAREAEIQLALERVRARTMAMHKSDELAEVAVLLFQQVKGLGITTYTSGFTIWDTNKNNLVSWMCNADGSINPPFIMPATEYGWHRLQYQSWKKQEDHIVHDFTGEALQRHYRYLRSFPLLDEAFCKSEQAGVETPGRQVHNVFNFSNGNLLFITLEPVMEYFGIFSRFAKVFEQSYTRFLDLQKAEAQAREAQIEAALEKVRATSLAMHHSNELNKVVATLLDRLINLGLLFNAGLIWTFDREKQSIETWIATPVLPDPVRVNLPYDPEFKDNLIVKKYWNSLDYGTDVLNEVFKGEIKQKYFEYVTRYNDEMVMPKPLRDLVATLDWTVSFAAEKNSLVGIDSWSGQVLTNEEFQILKRFARVFDQAYVRFLDLQKAEAQAREAQIEAALEKVRSRSLQMHKSNELKEVIAVVFDKLKELDFNMDSRAAIINIYTEGSKEFTEWIADPSQTYPTSFVIPDLPFDNLAHVWKAREKGADFTSRIIYKAEKNPFFDYLFVHTGYKYLPEEIKKIMLETEYYTYSIALGKNSGISMPDLSGKQMTESEVDILKRFAKVFDQAYTRFLDLQKAEAQAREAQIETVLEKIRSRSLAMQKPEELTEVAELLRREMGQLGVEELETSSIYIVKIENAQAECWYAIKDVREENTKLVSDEMTLQLNETWVGKQMVQFYQSNDGQISITMKGDQRKEWINYCAEKSNVLQGYYGDEIPERFYHLVKFNGGYIGAASPGAISAESWDLLRRAASVFSLAYTRFNDLQIAEAHARQAEQDLIAIKEAKQKAEAALDELQATQKQLIQSEKMASLGELTAGIAHEIQNPLNFVNNFSEVSKELLDEMKEAIEKGDTEVAKDIMNDVIQNLEKIHHHGKRADGIVKGMLQHSRVSSGQKELTDINGLCDEYLRLAFHGLKAKEKSFHAAMKTSLDESIPPISVIPQDLGRVLLNLMTNAFYTVNEKSKQGIPGYEPTVLISTKKEDHNVLISVKDNGQGISTTIRDKIFQPFFTTKPTGQGTGLGLSLAYDIIKAHGGDLWVETEEGKGSEFMVELPVE